MTLEKSWMDGSDRSSMVVLTAQEAHGLTADVAARRLYWISNFKKVSSGRKRQVMEVIETVDASCFCSFTVDLQAPSTGFIAHDFYGISTFGVQTGCDVNDISFRQNSFYGLKKN